MSQLVKEVIIMTAEYYRTTLSPQVLKMYADDLADLPEDKVVAAYRDYRRNPINRTNPLPAQIREMADPAAQVSIEVKAREIAARIIGAVPRYGHTNAKDAEFFIGPVGWRLVNRHGGWSHLCSNLGVTINSTTLQAQLRDQLEGTLRYGEEALDWSILNLTGARTTQGQLQSVGNVLSIPSRNTDPKEVS